MADKREGGLTINAGDRAYVPPGGLQLWVNSDGTMGSQMSLAIDPWLPDLSANAGTPVDVIQAIARQGFTVSSICTGQWIKACQKTHEVRELLAHPEVARLRHMAVVDGTQAIGILDLDRARGQVRYNDERSSLSVGKVYEPLSEEKQSSRRQSVDRLHPHCGHTSIPVGRNARKQDRHRRCRGSPKGARANPVVHAFYPTGRHVGAEAL